LSMFCVLQAKVVSIDTMFSGCPFVLPLHTSIHSSRYQTCKHNILKAGKLISVQKWSVEQGHEIVNFGGREVKGQGHKAEDRFGGLAAASFSTPFGRVAFLVDW